MNKLYVFGAALMLSPLFMNAQTDCTPHMQMSNDFENGNFNETGGAQIVANDFFVSAQTTNFSATSMTANLLTDAVLTSVDLKFFIDADGAPGEEITDVALVGVVPTSQEVVGTAFGYDVREVVIDFDAIDFPGTGTEAVAYWVQLSGANANTPSDEGASVGWETSTVNQIGSPFYFDNDNVDTWTVGNADAVFSMSGECTYIDGCNTPENVYISNITTTSIDVVWDETGSASEWVLEYGEPGFTIGSGTEINITDGTPSTTISDLSLNTAYEVYIKSVCGADFSENAGPVAFATNDNYCAVAVATAVEAITNVEFAGITNATNAGSVTPNEYFLNTEAMVNQGGTFPITVEGFTGGDYENTYTVFFDWNQDFDFDDAGERYDIGIIANSTGVDGISATTDITVPDDATLGATRMRVLKLYTTTQTYPLDACSAIGYGQSEDYTAVVDVPSSLEFAEYEFKMGPNPTKDFVNISATENIERIAIYNLVGQQVYVSRTNIQSPRIDFSSLENGVYLMSVTIKGQEQVFKVVKQ